MGEMMQAKDIAGAVEALREAHKSALRMDEAGHLEIDHLWNLLDESSSLIEAQQAEIERLKEGLRARTYDEAEYEKPDKEKRFHAEILAAHPSKTGDHATYSDAIELVSERHAKYDLVHLVNWLLIKEKWLLRALAGEEGARP